MVPPTSRAHPALPRPGRVTLLQSGAPRGYSPGFLTIFVWGPTASDRPGLRVVAGLEH